MKNMKNLKSFNEFLNEAKYYTLQQSIKSDPLYYKDVKDIYDEVQSIMKIKNSKDIGIISSDDSGTEEYDIFIALEDTFRGKPMDIDTEGWGNYYYDKKLNVVKAEDQGIDAYYFDLKDAKKLI